MITDHKPLTQILHPEKSLPVLCISRMANYADYLAHFNYTVVFKTTSANKNADYCSRRPLPSTIQKIRTSVSFQEIKEEFIETELDDFDHFVIHQIETLPVTAKLIAQETRKDALLGKIVQLLESGINLSRAGYKAPESNYMLAANCLMYEHRIVIPPTLRNAILRDLHSAHLGMVKMKGMARSFVYWPTLNADIEKTANSCENCLKHAHLPPKFRSHHWEYPKNPWERIHIDYAGPVAGKMLLIIVDAYSKWIEVKTTNSITSLASINILEEMFATYGVPVIVVSDNGRQFISEEFKEFLKRSGVKYHKTTAPYHPSTNGQAERSVQTVKDALKTMSTSSKSIQHDLNVFLQQYRKAPHSTTGLAPSQLFLRRNIRTRLDLVRPQTIDIEISEKQRANFDSTFTEYEPGQLIYFLSGNPRTDKWLKGKIVKRVGDLHYEIEYCDRLFKRHVDQMKSFYQSNPEMTNENFTFQNTIESNIDNNPRKIRFYGNQDHVPEIPRQSTETRAEANRCNQQPTITRQSSQYSNHPNKPNPITIKNKQTSSHLPSNIQPKNTNKSRLPVLVKKPITQTLQQSKTVIKTTQKPKTQRSTTVPIRRSTRERRGPSVYMNERKYK